MIHMKQNAQLKLKRGQKINLSATYEGETEDGLAIISVGTVDNYVITLDPKDLATTKQPS